MAFAATAPLIGITGYLVKYQSLVNTGVWDHLLDEYLMPCPTYQIGQTVSNYANLFIHPDIDMDYIAISIRAQLNRFALALSLSTIMNDDGFSMMTTTFLL